MNKLSVKKIETQEQRQILRIQIFSQNNEISKNESEKNEEKLDPRGKAYIPNMKSYNSVQ